LRRAIAGFLAGYAGQTITSYDVDLRKWVEWLDTAGIAVFGLVSLEGAVPAGAVAA
jgi:hypothetical protein